MLSSTATAMIHVGGEWGDVDGDVVAVSKLRGEIRLRHFMQYALRHCFHVAFALLWKRVALVCVTLPLRLHCAACTCTALRDAGIVHGSYNRATWTSRLSLLHRRH